MTDKNELNLADFKKRLGPEYWRSLESLPREDFEQVVETEFPAGALALERGVDRRDFVKLMGASMALGGLAACNRPAEKIVPYVRQPENLIPGQPIFFASAMPISGYAHGVLVESHMGRPTKIEGNPDHPSSLGATNSWMQASILGLYDPDRSQVVRHLGEISTWSEFLATLAPAIKGGGVRLLTQTITSPTLGAQIQQFLAQSPGAKWHQWEPAGGQNVREGLRLAFGGYVNAVYHFDKANVVVSLDSDVLERGPGHLRYARDFSSRRKVRKGTTSINRLYAIESGPTGTGSIADHRLAVRPSQIEAYARAIAGSGSAPDHADWIAALVRDLQKNRGASIVVAGDEQPPAVHAIAMAINQALGNIGSTITITDPVEVAPVNQLDSLKQLVADMNAGAVKTLIILGGNPAYDAPTDVPFVKAMDKVPFRAHLSHYYDETSMHAHWHIPETHYLESWSDARAHDGTVSIVQPLIAPLYNGRSPHEVLGALLGGLDASPYDVVRSYWSAKAGALNFNATWRKWLNDGVIAGSALPARTAGGTPALPGATGQPGNPATYELRILPDPNIYDGRYANNAWLQELPKPQTKICWENVALVSPKTAVAIGYDDKRRDALVNEKQTLIADVKYRGRTLRTPIWVLPGHPDGTITMYMGYGRTRGGRVATPDPNTKGMYGPDLEAFHISGNTMGVDLTPFRFADALNGGPGADIALTDAGPYEVACTQEHQSLNASDVGADRGIIRSASFEEYLKKPDFAHEYKREEEQSKETMYPQYDYSKGHAWAMVIDTSVCTGCNGCVIACQSENNIPVVGKEQVVAEREMHWLRIDRYYKGDAENPEVYHQPVPCMQCEQAPCEPVCPVGATSHSGEGLNDMTYNRCVGTRYCSNNCPYKVRRFNFFHYADYETPALKAQRNPDVTTRTRGVMEKCTYCVQRINAAKIDAEKQGRRVRDGEVVTACQQACPTDAIVFGDMNDPKSKVAALKGEPTNYALLAELNTRPRTTYLGAIRNPNPEIKG